MYNHKLRILKIRIGWSAWYRSLDLWLKILRKCTWILRVVDVLLTCAMRSILLIGQISVSYSFLLPSVRSEALGHPLDTLNACSYLFLPQFKEVEHLIVGLDWHLIQSLVSCYLILSKFIESPGWLKILNRCNKISIHKQVISNSGLIIQDGKSLACQAYEMLGTKSTEH